MYTMFLEDFTYPLEKEMATHSSILAWKTPWTENPGGLQSTAREGRDLGVAFQAPPGSQASSRGEATPVPP